jgi:pimeloyl-ACP methyl ester carboxylesterase
MYAMFFSAVQAPTLVLHATGDQMFPVSHGRYVAEHLPNATLVEFDATDHLHWPELGDRGR